jgi:hypothetical protein
MPLEDVGGFDLRPRVIFHTAAGAVVVTVDPTSAVGGNAIFPVLGAVPYYVDIDTTTVIPTPRVVLQFPTGAYPIPIDLSGLGGGGGLTPLSLPGLGDVTYEVVMGPPQLDESEYASAGSLALFGLSQYWPLIAGGLLVAFLMFRKS